MNKTAEVFPPDQTPLALKRVKLAQTQCALRLPWNTVVAKSPSGSGAYMTECARSLNERSRGATGLHLTNDTFTLTSKDSHARRSEGIGVQSHPHLQRRWRQQRFCQRAQARLLE